MVDSSIYNSITRHFLTTHDCFIETQYSLWFFPSTKLKKETIFKNNNNNKNPSKYTNTAFLNISIFKSILNFLSQIPKINQEKEASPL